jgi:hypothetical protein
MDSIPMPSAKEGMLVPISCIIRCPILWPVWSCNGLTGRIIMMGGKPPQLKSSSLSGIVLNSNYRRLFNFEACLNLIPVILIRNFHLVFYNYFGTKSFKNQ